MSNEDELEVWPSFVDLLAGASMFLLLAFAATTIVHLRVQSTQLAELEQLRASSARHQSNVENLLGSLQAALSDVEGAECGSDGKDVVCRFSDELTFRTGEARLRSEDAARVLEGFGRQLSRQIEGGLPVERIVVEGHTDRTKFRNVVEAGANPNWELSSQRAGHIVNFLISRASLPAERFEAIGYGEYRPKVYPDGRIASDEEQRFVVVRVRLRQREEPVADRVN